MGKFRLANMYHPGPGLLRQGGGVVRAAGIHHNKLQPAQALLAFQGVQQAGQLVGAVIGGDDHRDFPPVGNKFPRHVPYLFIRHDERPEGEKSILILGKPAFSGDPAGYFFQRPGDAVFFQIAQGLLRVSREYGKTAHRLPYILS